MRFYSHKYPGARDAFLAYPWRYVRDANVRPGSFMMTSRDIAVDVLFEHLIKNESKQQRAASRWPQFTFLSVLTARG